MGGPKYSLLRGSVRGRLLPTFLVCVASSVNAQVRYISNAAERDVFVVAHQDDWQVFMGDVATRILRSGSPATFIYLTAGDDGRDSLYWQTRERAALHSTQVAMGRPAAPDGIACASVIVLQRPLQKCSVGNVDAYFLRLPDGRRNGAGFARYGHESLRLLKAGKISTITSVDKRATYTGWRDVVSMVDHLIGIGRGADFVVHTTDPSKVLNPHDHFDHRMVGLMIEEVRKQRGMPVRYYAGYALASRAPNRTSEQTRDKTEVFLAYDAEMTRADKTWSASSEHRAFYSQCMQRTYVRSARPLR